MDPKNQKGLSLRNFFSTPIWDEDFWDFNHAAQTGLSVSEDKDHVYVEAQVPGLSSEDIEVSMEKGTLWIHGEKKEEEKDKKKKFYRKASTSFSYRVQVPGSIDEKKEPEATYKDGVIKISFNKTPNAQSKKITIKKK